MVFEKSVSEKKWYQKTPGIIKWAVTMFIVMIGWTVFRYGTFSETIQFFKIMLGAGAADNVTFTYQYYITLKVVVMLLIAVFGATILNYILQSPLYCKYKNVIPVLCAKYIISIGLFVIVLICVANSTYSPFIYFQY